MIAWFRTKRQLIADIDRERATVANRDEHIAYLDEVIQEGATQAEARIAELQESLRFAHRAMNTQRRLRIEADERLAAVVDELHKLRDDIAREEQAAPSGVGIHPNLPSATGVGMARPADLADAIDQETAAKRLADGLGDPA